MVVLILNRVYFSLSLSSYSVSLRTHLNRLLSSRSAGGSVVMRLTSSCMQWSWERKRSSRRFWALHSCRTSSSSISSLSVTSSLSSSWSMWEVVCRSNFQNMVAAGTGDTALGHRNAKREGRESKGQKHRDGGR